MNAAAQGGSAFSQLGVVIANPSIIIRTIGTALPSSSNFFITYVLIQVQPLSRSVPPICLMAGTLHTEREVHFACHRNLRVRTPILKGLRVDTLLAETAALASAVHAHRPWSCVSLAMKAGDADGCTDGLPQAIAMIPFRIMYPHIGSLLGLFRLCGYCSEHSTPFPALLSCFQEGSSSCVRPVTQPIKPLRSRHQPPLMIKGCGGGRAAALSGSDTSL